MSKGVQFSLIKLLVWCPFVGLCLGYFMRVLSLLPTSFVTGFLNVAFFANYPRVTKFRSTELTDGYGLGCIAGIVFVGIGLAVFAKTAVSICGALSRRE